MTEHAIIEAGPAIIRRLDCSTAPPGEMAAAALDAIDDEVALVDDQPVSVDSLWRTVLQSVLGGAQRRVTVVHPSWWAASRVDVVNDAARQLADRVVTQRRSWLLGQASPDQSTVIVEIAERFVVITAAAVVAESRRGKPDAVAESVTHVIAGMATETTSTVVIDAPSTIAGASTLASMIADGVRRSRADLTLVQVDDARLKQLAVGAFSAREDDGAPDAAQVGCGRRKRVRAAVLVATAASAVMLAVGFGDRHSAPPAGAIPTTFLVEGRVALSVPAQWRVERVVGGPGSARVQLTSPSDPEVALHVTQSPVGHETLTAAAESLKRAIDAEPSGVFVDFSPSGTSAGRPAVTYREVRPRHDIRWTVLLDGPVRISIGCQTGAGGASAILDVCEQAVRSAHAVR